MDEDVGISTPHPPTFAVSIKCVLHTSKCSWNFFIKSDPEYPEFSTLPHP